jgi:hypothetical protein
MGQGSEVGSAFWGDTVFLEAAVGFIGEGSLDETGGKGWLKVGKTEMFVMLEVKQFLEFLPTPLCGQDKQHPTDFPGDFPGD